MTVENYMVTLQKQAIFKIDFINDKVETYVANVVV